LRKEEVGRVFEQNFTAASFEKKHIPVGVFGAATVVTLLGRKLIPIGRAQGTNTTNKAPQWERRLVGQVERIRKNIAHLTQFISGRRTNKIKRSAEFILRNTRRHARDESNQTPEECLDTLKQRLSVLASRLLRYRKSAKRKRDNATFGADQKGFYRVLNMLTANAHGPSPSKESLQEFWGVCCRTRRGIVSVVIG